MFRFRQGPPSFGTRQSRSDILRKLHVSLRRRRRIRSVIQLPDACITSFSNSAKMVRDVKKSKMNIITSTPKKGASEPVSTPAGLTPSSKRRKSGSFYRKKVKSAKSPDEKKRKHRWHPGTTALREIRKYQKETKLLVPKLPFSRVIREVLNEQGKEYRIQSLALEALQEAAECYVVGVLEMANLCSIHARRVTIYPHDMKLVRRIRGDC